MVIKTPNDLFIRLLSEINSAEKQITRALPKMARAADDPQLAEAFKEHLEETRGQVERIEQAVDTIPDIRVKRIKSYAMESLIEEGQELIEAGEKGPVLDAALIGAAQKVEHFEIAAYGTVISLAGQLGYTEAKNILAETLKEEKATDEKLTKLAKKDINQKAG
ncbi:ferritin-like domain-containing protein [Modicisalibacter xianhensis]|uniref:Ferritin-like metal-binding protein YciE n=1 Tax=Modicisalibacter xianhensis TaxID=442341 RepID=A0A1I3ANW5_9GAMM|nr:ferritin-like domain-containing protein [Halomonas xianhensis]SFH51476.1 Ferritin-like metal-binding protein YciE [Halomonas xianhensis]